MLLKTGTCLEPPPFSILSNEEYELIAIEHVERGTSWEETKQLVFTGDNKPHLVVLNKLQQMYLGALKEAVMCSTLDNITELCCLRDEQFFKLLATFPNPTIESELWSEISCHRWKYLGSESRKHDLERSQWMELMELIKGNEKVGKQLSSRVRKLLNILVAHFANNKPEKELLRLIVNWFQSGDMNKAQRDQWREMHESRNVSLKLMREAEWKTEVGDAHMDRLRSAIDDVPARKFFDETTKQLMEILGCFLRKPTFDEQSTVQGTILTIAARTVFVSDIKEEDRFAKNDSIIEVRLYAKDCLVLDEDLEQEVWHGKNLAVITEKIVVDKEAAVIDVSGNASCDTSVIGKAEKGTTGGSGRDGTDGTAGESSGNVTIVTNQVKNGDNLKIVMKGGDGSGGEDGGDGGDGRMGVGVTKEDIINTCISYGSLYLTPWEHFIDWAPGGYWTERRGFYSYSDEYVWREFNDQHGRELIYSLAGYKKHKLFPTTYELYFLMKGTAGSVGGNGGKNGVGGEGGNSGEPHSIDLSSGRTLQNIQTEQVRGRDGKDGKCGTPGTAGRNGNDMVMIDRSAMKPSKFYLPDDRNMKISLRKHYDSSESTRLDGKLKHLDNQTNCFVEFKWDPVEVLSSTEQTEKRSSNDRRSQSKTVSKTTIMTAAIMSDFRDLFASDENTIEIASSEQQEWQEIEVDDEIEEVAELQQEVSVVRTHVEASGKHERNCRVKMVNPEAVLEKVEKAVTSSEIIPLIEMISVWTDIFKTPLTITTTIEVSLKKLHDTFYFYKLDSIFATNERLENGMSKEDVRNFRKEIKEKLPRKVELSRLVSSLVTNPETSDELILEEDCLKDVETCDSFEDFWKDKDLTNQEAKENLQAFMDKQQFLSADTELLIQLYDILQYLQTKRERFDIFKKDELNWADLDKVQNHLDGFLTENEKKKKEKQLKKEEEERQRKKLDEKPHPVGEQAVGDDVKGNSFLKLGTKLMNYVDSFAADGGTAFTSIAKISKKGKTVFEGLNQLAKQNQRIYERFALKIGRLGRPDEIGSYAYSVIQLYFLSQQILDYNIRLLRYWKLYSSEVLVPTNWYETGLEGAVEDYQNFVSDIRTNGMPTVHDGLMSFMLKHGLHCSAYRHYLSDTYQVNIQVFYNYGYSTVRLLENLNPQYRNTHRIHVGTNGNLGSIRPNAEVRKLRMEVNSRSINIQLPQSEVTPPLKQWFHKAFRSKIQEWSEAIEICTDSDSFLRFLHELYSLRGCPSSFVEFQFMINTTIDVLNNINVPLHQLCCQLLSTDGTLVDAWLALRVICSMKGRVKGFVNLLQRLHCIREPRLRALFGSKLHGMEIDDETLQILINMLAHAEDRVQELEKMHLNEWIDIAKFQKWNDFEPLLKNFGDLGYYLVYLESNQRPESEKLKKIINQLAQSDCYIFEKMIARLVFLISYNEVEFSEPYERAVLQLLHSTNCKASTKLLDIEGAQMTRTGNICLVTDECEQLTIMNGKELVAEMDIVFCQKDRSLEDLVKLTVNPQDTSEEREKRMNQMTAVKQAIESVNNRNPCNKWAEHLQKIDDVLFDKCGVRLRDTQKIAVMSAAMSESNLLSQVNTGEGKSYIIATLVLLRILMSDKKDTVDIITSSSVLAQRDAEDMKEVYAAFGITAGHNCDDDTEKRKMAYKCSVVYGDIARFERDYLMHTFYKKNILGSRTRCNVIVDEVDSMLLDSGSNMLYLSHTVAGIDLLEPLFVYIHKEVRRPSSNNQANGNSEDPFDTEEIRRNVLNDMCGLVTKGDLIDLLRDVNGTSVGKVWRNLLKNNIIEDSGLVKHYKESDMKQLRVDLQEECGSETYQRVIVMMAAIRNRDKEIDVPGYLQEIALRHLDEFIDNAKKALFLEHEIEYVVDLDHTSQNGDLNAQITIIDRGTGTDLNTSQWSEGLHQFLQLKHGCRLSPLSMKAVFISNVTYLKGYKKLNGFSGTLGSEEESKSLVTLYQADILRIPTWKAKNFSENVPVLTTEPEEWIQNVFDEVVDQVEAGRSVLVICESISAVIEMEKGLRGLYEELEESTEIVTGCFKNVIVYKREFDEFDFSATQGLTTSRLIISTNLAGRGTDIKLTNELAGAGGLHVIVSFLPENSRIEDQAYGRAARCGQPGSAQIIALVTDGTNHGAKNIFQLKQFRDNAEVHRVRSLKQYYDFHIEVEETCLNLFRDHCSRALEGVHSGSELQESLPTSQQVVYFALLDAWAEWLDARTDDIKRCEKNCSSGEKAFIIKQAKTFLSYHPLPSSSEAYSSPWINTPQPIITLALIDIAGEAHSGAVAKLNRVALEFPEFAAEAHYYLGITSQQKIRHIKTEFIREAEAMKEEDFKWFNPLHWLQYGRDEAVKKMNKAMHKMAKKTADDIRNSPESMIKNSMEELENAFKHLLLSRAMFACRISRKMEMTNIVTMLQSSTTQIISQGYVDQQKDAKSVLEGFLGNIDDMLGHSVSSEDLKIERELPFKQIERFAEYVSSGIISPVTASKKIIADQMMIIVKNHRLPMATLRRAVQALQRCSPLDHDFTGNNESFSAEQDKSHSSIINSSILPTLLTMPSILGFWESMSRANCFVDISYFLAVRKDHTHQIPMLSDIDKTTIDDNPFSAHISTNDLKGCDLYKMSTLSKKLDKDIQSNIRLKQYLDAGFATIELVGLLDPRITSRDVRLDQFDYVTIDDVMDGMDVPRSSAEGIIQWLIKGGVLKEDSIGAQEQGFVSKEESMKTEEAGTGLIGSEKREQCEDKTEDKKKTLKTVYRTIGRPSFSFIPRNLRQAIQKIVTRQTCYGYALRVLKSSIQEVLEGKAVQHRIMLPGNPYEDLFADLLMSGALQRHRVTYVIEDVYKPAKNWKTDTHYIPSELYQVLEKKKPNILLNSSNLLSTASYLKEKCVPAGAEINRAVSNGMRQLARVEKPNPWKWAFSLFCKLILAVVVVLMVSSVFVSPQVFSIALAAIAALGTTLYFLSIMSENQKLFAEDHSIGDLHEFAVLKDCHEVAIRENRKKQKKQELSEVIESVSKRFKKRMTDSLKTALCLSRSKELCCDIRCIEEACQSSEHMPLLEQGIHNWIKSASRSLQKECYPLIGHLSTGSKTDAADLGRLRELAEQLEIPEAPASIFAFASLLVADVNVKLKSQNKTMIQALLDFDDYRKEQITSEKTESLTVASVLNSVISACVERIYLAGVDGTIHPAELRLDAVCRGRPPIGTLQLDAQTIKAKSITHSSNHLAKEDANDILSTDLQNIFLRICYKGVRPSVLSHMVKYNYPLSAHCATALLDSVMHLLHCIGCSFGKVTFTLERENQGIYKYILQPIDEKNTTAATEVHLSLLNDCFYSTERLDHSSNHRKYPVGLFQAMCEHFETFSDAFPLGPEEFIEKLAAEAGKGRDVSEKGIRSVEWHAHEELVCSVAI